MSGVCSSTFQSTLPSGKKAAVNPAAKDCFVAGNGSLAAERKPRQRGLDKGKEVKWEA